MRTFTGLASAVTGVAIGIAGGMAFAQGSLTPPGGPAETMKTLDQLYVAIKNTDPRTPITNAPYTITQPGSYYLATNVNSTEHGIVIQSSGVTLDLMGFSLTGNGSSWTGIWLKGTTNVVIRNGMVSRFEDGVVCDGAQNSRMEWLVVSKNARYGVNLKSSLGICKGNAIQHCTVSGNTLGGVFLNGHSGICNENRISDCVVSGNGSCGIFLSSGSGQCNANTVADCTIGSSVSIGVYLDGNTGQCNGNRIVDCTICGSGFSGVKLDGTSGECVGNEVAHCVLRTNSVNGIQLFMANGNKIENNLVSGTSGSPSYGINLGLSGSNLVVRNTCVGQTGNYNIPANNTYGPYVTGFGAMATTNGAPELSPWANFSY